MCYNVLWKVGKGTKQKGAAMSSRDSKTKLTDPAASLQLRPEAERALDKILRENADQSCLGDGPEHPEEVAISCYIAGHVAATRRACNVHDDLLAVTKSAANMIDLICMTLDDGGPHLERKRKPIGVLAKRLRAAIAKAEREKT